MISPAALKKWGRDIALHPVGTGPFEFVEWKQTDDLKVKKFAGYWKKGYPKIDAIDWKPVVDNNTRAALIKTGEADFAFRIPFEQAVDLKATRRSTSWSGRRSCSARVAEHAAEAVRQPEGAPALNYAVNKEALAKVAFSGFATPSTGVVPQGVDYATKLGSGRTTRRTRALLKEAGYPNGFGDDVVRV